MAAPAYPRKTREIFTHHLDSRAWNDFVFRDDDIVIATYAKSGTTWMQQIVSQLVFGGRDDIDVHRLSPWYDLRVLPPEARQAVADQQHRRFLKTHLPIDALVFSPKARYIYVGRDGRDAAWSFHNHHHNGTEEYFRLYNSGLPEGFPVLERGPDDPRDFYRQWFAGNGFPIWPFWENVRGWWAVRGLPNVMLVHFNDLKADLEGEIRRIAAFLEIDVGTETLARAVAHSSFDYMKSHAASVAPRGGVLWKGGAETFINKGSNGRWRDRLTPEDVEAYERRAVQELGPDCARWLAEGGPYA
jgi:aryl sulfotransferase